MGPWLHVRQGSKKGMFVKKGIAAYVCVCTGLRMCTHSDLGVQVDLPDVSVSECVFPQVPHTSDLEVLLRMSWSLYVRTSVVPCFNQLF